MVVNSFALFFPADNEKSESMELTQELPSNNNTTIESNKTRNFKNLSKMSSSQIIYKTKSLVVEKSESSGQEGKCKKIGLEEQSSYIGQGEESEKIEQEDYSLKVHEIQRY